MVILNFNVPADVLQAIRREAEESGTDISKVARKHLLKGMEIANQERFAKEQKERVERQVARFFGKDVPQ